MLLNIHISLIAVIYHVARRLEQWHDQKRNCEVDKRQKGRSDTYATDVRRQRCVSCCREINAESWADEKTAGGRPQRTDERRALNNSTTKLR